MYFCDNLRFASGRIALKGKLRAEGRAGTPGMPDARYRGAAGPQKCSLAEKMAEGATGAKLGRRGWRMPAGNPVERISPVVGQDGRAALGLQLRDAGCPTRWLSSRSCMTTGWQLSGLVPVRFGALVMSNGTIGAALMTI